MNKFRHLEQFFMTIEADLEVGACYLKEYGPPQNVKKLLDASNDCYELAEIFKNLGKPTYSDSRKEYLSDLVTRFYSFKNNIVAGFKLLIKTDNKHEIEIKLLLAHEQFTKIERLIQIETRRDSGPAI